MGERLTTDWWRVITDLQQAGIPMLSIGKVMGDVQLTNQMLVHYRAGTEPLHWRGELLLTYWCTMMKKAREDRPMRPQIKGRYRAIGTGVRPSHEALQPGYDGPLKHMAQAKMGEGALSAPPAETVPAPEAPVVERKKPGPKPGTRRKVAAVV
jgi:hypothetical protein